MEDGGFQSHLLTKFGVKWFCTIPADKPINKHTQVKTGRGDE